MNQLFQKLILLDKSTLMVLHLEYPVMHEPFGLRAWIINKQVITNAESQNLL
jgi:hypothetical protein